jgi:hypothetical protein
MSRAIFRVADDSLGREEDNMLVVVAFDREAAQSARGGSYPGRRRWPVEFPS